jgi:hypothetical protein
MEKEFDYREAAGYAIKQLGGMESVKRRMIVSGRYFREITLPERIPQWWTAPPHPDPEMLFGAILSKVKEQHPDILKELREIRRDAGKFCDRLDNLLFHLDGFDDIHSD